ncbi:hypothetical protein HII36_19020 [Nonomuraea sp. NN258]|uniref:hypothetical protein n=1 Tax=Nonomuraea antri TaxID=2730852 RepID=UPI001569D54E|nr:hypothetical protein [Nonomuraea antri]NRQ33926.1 hypothetical protein [Nonomuraea antri]
MSREKKRRARSAKKQRARSQGARAGRSDASSSEITIAEVYERMARYVRSTTSYEEAAAAARADLQSAVEEVSRLACGLDLIKVVSSVRVAMIMNRVTTGVDVSAAVLELITLVLACRDSATSKPAAEPDESAFMPPHLEAASREALATGSMMAMFDSPPSDAESAILFYSVQREITLRNAVYPHMLLDTLHGLFADPAVNNECRTVLGFTGLEAVNVIEAVRSLSISELGKRFAGLESARDESLPYILSWMSDRQGEAQPSTEEHRIAAQKVFDAVQGLTTNIDHATVIDPEAIAQRTGYERSTVETILEAFSLPSLTEVDEILGRFFQGDNPLRVAPIVTGAQGRRMLVHDGLALPAVREVIETRLAAANRWDAYKRNRGEWVEKTAIDLLAGVLPGAQVFRGFNYFVPDPKAAILQTEPEKFTKRVEGDGLMLIDDVALLIEVKAVALTAEARGGVARRLRGKLRDIVTDAANQAERLRERIITDKRIRLDDDQWIDVSGVREIHTIAVGLEDLSGVTTATTMLLAAGILKPDHIPWTVSVHDLRIVCELLDHPSELLLYLRRRTEPEATWKYRAVDELDLFLLFLHRGLYVERDPRRTAEELPWAEPPSTATLRRFAAQGPEFVTSHTEPLDAWYDSQLDSSASPADKPRLNADQKLLELVEQITGTEAPGWLSTATSLLEGDGKVQRRFGRYATDLAKLVRRDRKHHSVTHLMGETSGNHVLLVWACHGPDEDVDTVVSYLMDYLHAKKYQTGAYRAACMLFDASGKHLLRLLYDNRPPQPDPVLEKAAARLVPLERMARTMPRPMRPH